jgi:hypothetical protein
MPVDIAIPMASSSHPVVFRGLELSMTAPTSGKPNHERAQPSERRAAVTRMTADASASRVATSSRSTSKRDRLVLMADRLLCETLRPRYHSPSGEQPELRLEVPGVDVGEEGHCPVEALSGFALPTRPMMKIGEVIP